MIPSSRPKLSDLYTLSQSKLPENHTLHSGTYLYSLYMAVPPPPGFGDAHSAPTVKVVRGTPKGIYWDPLCFWFTYVNDVPNCHLAGDIILYADYTGEQDLWNRNILELWIYSASSVHWPLTSGASQYLKLIYVATVLVVTGEPEI